MNKWKDIVGFEGKYQVSSSGEVKSLKRRFVKKSKILKTYTDRDGYSTLVLHGIKPTSKKVHRLVAEAFIKNLKDLPQVNHIDGNPSNNCVDNLEWVDNRANQKHRKEVLRGDTLPIGVSDSHRIKNKYVAQIQLDKVSYRLYYGNSIEDAYKAYQTALYNYEEKGELPKEYPNNKREKGIYFTKENNTYRYQVPNGDKRITKGGFKTIAEAVIQRDLKLEELNRK